MAEEFYSFKRFVTAFDHTDLDESGVASALADVRRVQRVLDGLVARLSSQADLLANRGSSAPGAEMLRGAGAVGARQAAKEARRGDTAASFPAVGAALSEGQTTGAHVDAVGDLTHDLTDDQVALLDIEAVVASACAVPVETFRRSLKRQIDAITADNGMADAVAKQQAARLRLWHNEQTGMGHISGELDPEGFEKLRNAIEHRMTQLCSLSDQPVTKDERLAAQALIDLITGGSGIGAGGGGGVPSIVVVVDAKTMIDGPHPGSIRETETGAELAAETISRLACDAALRRVTLDERGVPLNVGRKYRTATDPQWAAIKALHRTCAWDDCDAPINHCQLHHILEWEHGGPTDLDNLIPLCSRHHHRVHEGRWQVKLLPDRTLEIFKPNGRHHATVQPPQRC